MQGEFIGKTSMGFVNGKVYNIESKVQKIIKYGIPMLCICIYDKDSNAWCPYSNLETMIKKRRTSVLRMLL